MLNTNTELFNTNKNRSIECQSNLSETLYLNIKIKKPGMHMMVQQNRPTGEMLGLTIYQ